eukprot:4356457-Pyramimonas_sp.AAC.1
MDGRKSSLTQHANVGHKLARATSKLGRLVEDIEEQDKLSAEIQQRKQELVAKKTATEAELAALQKQL